MAILILDQSNWHIPAFDAALVALLFAGLLLAIGSVLFNRLVFARYVRKVHPQVYERLTSDEARMNTGRITSDATNEMRLFRTRGADLGDPALVRLRRISRTLVKVCVGCYVGIALVIAVYACLAMQPHP